MKTLLVILLFDLFLSHCHPTIQTVTNPKGRLNVCWPVLRVRVILHVGVITRILVSKVPLHSIMYTKWNRTPGSRVFTSTASTGRSRLRCCTMWRIDDDLHEFIHSHFNIAWRSPVAGLRVFRRAGTLEQNEISQAF
ncbi:hypothetical protein C8R42DRAFT_874 [Lentinula raphanica]|nr:hypothetical protein C8R42DRAFT_874 [Lentinula raphanica]